LDAQYSNANADFDTYFFDRPIAYWLMREWLNDFAYRIELNVLLFIIPGLSALVIAVITVSTQAIKAALINPVENLRSE
jgi:putative ABC transport system permease protein